MKFFAPAVALAVAATLAASSGAHAQTVYQSQMQTQAAPMATDATMQNFNRQVSADPSSATRLGGTRAEQIQNALYQDRQAIKALKSQLKATQDPDQRAAIKDSIGKLQSDMIAIQQQ